MIYLDYNATTPVAPEVVKAITSAFEDGWANPSSGYKRGQVAKLQLEAARTKIAKMLDVEDEATNVITFTSGGTEVNIQTKNVVLKICSLFFVKSVFLNI